MAGEGLLIIVGLVALCRLANKGFDTAIVPAFAGLFENGTRLVALNCCPCLLACSGLMSALPTETLGAIYLEAEFEKAPEYLDCETEYLLVVDFSDDFAVAAGDGLLCARP